MVATSDALTAVGPSGEEEWTVDADDLGYGIAAPGRDDVFLESQNDGFEVRSVETGVPLWHGEGLLMEASSDWVLLKNEAQLIQHDLDTGQETWRVDSNGPVAVDSDAIFEVDRQVLTKLTHEGRAVWDVDLEMPGLSYLVVAEGFLVAAGRTALTAYDTADGSELWSAEVGQGMNAGLLTASRVYAFSAVYDETQPDRSTTVLLFDHDGEAATAQIDSGPGQPFFFALLAGGSAYAVDTATGIFYDGRMRPGGKEVGPVRWPVKGGAYVQDGNDLVHVTAPTGAEQWRLEIGAEAHPLAVGDERLIVVDGTTVRAYG
jgi:outer membrane protein assembly factor BamB